MQVTKEFQERVWLTRIKGSLNMRLAIVEVRPGETREDSWQRHLTDHPEAKNANIRVFNWTKDDERGLNSGTGAIS
ncbi:MAG: hypothetical protein P8168_08360 [Deltaproteobacteria bacterium]|jgi:hypothetical protein